MTLINLVSHPKKNNILGLIILILVLVLIPTTIQLVKQTQDNRSSATENYQTKLTFKISFKGIKPSSYCVNSLQPPKTEIFDNHNKVYLIGNPVNFKPISGETNKFGDQVFEIQGVITDSQSPTIKFIRIKGDSHTAIVLCQNNQTKKITNPNSCSINFNNDTVYDFSNYPLPPGNTNQDETINSLDFSIIKNGVSPGGETICNNKSDLNGDGTVNSIDLNLVKEYLFVSDESLETINPTPTTNNTPLTPTNIKPTITPTDKPIAILSFSVDSNQIITSVGKSRKIIISNILPTNTTQQTATYTSSNNLIATVNNQGIITGVNQGKTTISVKIGNIAQQISVEVIPAGDKVYFLKSEISSETPADTIILESDGKYGMIDAGNTTVAKKFLKYLGVSSIDFMLLTHWHTDHYMGFTDILTNYPVNSVYLKPYSGYDADENTTKSLRQQRIDLFNKLKSWPNTNYKEISKNNSFTLGNFKFDLFNTVERLTVEGEPSPGYYCLNFNSGSSSNQCNENTNSVATLATVNGKKIYLTGDIQNQLIYTSSNQSSSILKKAETEAADRIVKYRCNNVSQNCIDVYKLAHHGFGLNSNTADVISKLDPKYAIATTPINKYNIWLKTYPNLHKLNEFIQKNNQTLNLNGTNQTNKILLTGEGTVILNIDPSGNLDFITLNY